MKKVLKEIESERAIQDQKWGIDHDDNHTLEEWADLICAYATWAKAMYKMRSLKKYRRRMKQVAAIAVACCESFDRLYGEFDDKV